MDDQVRERANKIKKGRLCPLCEDSNRMMGLKLVYSANKCKIWRVVCTGTDQHWITLSEKLKWENGEISRVEIRSRLKERSKEAKDGKLGKLSDRLQDFPLFPK